MKNPNFRMPSNKQIARVILKGLGKDPDKIKSRNGNPVHDASYEQVKAWMKKNLL